MLKDDGGDTNVVVISPQLRTVADNIDHILRGHVIDDYVRSSDFDNDLVFETENHHAKIRINVYKTANKVGRRLIDVA